MTPSARSRTQLRGQLHPLAMPALPLPIPWELLPPARALLLLCPWQPLAVIDARSSPSVLSEAVNGEKTEEAAP